MNKKIYIIFLSFLNIQAFDIVDFDLSMKIAKHHRFASKKNNLQILDFLKKLYEKNNPFAIAKTMDCKDEQLKIPKIIHHIWLGEKLPEKFVSLRKSWIDNHPDWTFIFWTDNSKNYDQGQMVIDSFEELNHILGNKKLFPGCIVVNVKQLTFNNRIFYDEGANYGEKSDILRLEIVYRFGGLYVDTDYECLKPHDKLHYMYDFYAGIQPLDLGIAQVGNSLYGACSEHPILKACIEGIKENQHIKNTVIKTGPIYFTKCFLKTAHDGNFVNIALPATYLYPCDYKQRKFAITPSMWKRPESYAVHHWAGSWIVPSDKAVAQ